MNSRNLLRNTVVGKVHNFPPSWFAYYSIRIGYSTIGFGLWTRTDFSLCNFPGNKKDAFQQNHILDNNCLEGVERSTINSLIYKLRFHNERSHFHQQVEWLENPEDYHYFHKDKHLSNALQIDSRYLHTEWMKNSSGGDSNFIIVIFKIILRDQKDRLQ